MTTKRRWLKSAILAASAQEVILPWTSKRIKRRARTAGDDATLIRIMPSSPTKFGAIAAR